MNVLFYLSPLEGREWTGGSDDFEKERKNVFVCLFVYALTSVMRCPRQCLINFIRWTFVHNFYHFTPFAIYRLVLFEIVKCDL